MSEAALPAEPTRVVVVAAPCTFRAELRRCLQRAGAEPYESDDGIDGIGRVVEVGARLVLVADDAGVPGAEAIRRLLSRKVPGATVFRLVEAGDGDPSSRVLRRSSGVAPVAEALLGRLVPPAEDRGPVRQEAAAAPPASALGPVEASLAQGRWDEIRAALGPPERAADLPPRLALIYSIASVEAAPSAGGDPHSLAIRSVGRLLGIDEGSAAAVVLAKRLLRRAPGRWKAAQPRRRTSVLALLLALVVGGIVGLAASGLLF